MDTRPIGVFDSGVGGLSILKELVKLMPNEQYIFVADQANVPYGEKTKKELESITLNICDFLASKRSKIIVVACNTATCYAIDSIRNKVHLPIVGTVPAIKPAAEKSRSGIIGMLSTPATSKSRYIKNLIKLHAKNIKVTNIGCPYLEDIVESGNLHSLKLSRLVDNYVGPIKKAGADVVILGCTHYPFLKPQIKQAIGTKIKMVDSGKAVARRTKEILKRSGTLNMSGGGITFYTTGNPYKFSKTASLLLKRSVRSKRVSL